MPDIYVIAGPNGAGKTTAAFEVLPELGCIEFVNADLIAVGLSPFNPDSEAIKAGRLLLTKIKELAESKQDFAFETTLASRSFLPFLKDCKKNGYSIHLIYFYLANSTLALNRVKQRVQKGGHSIPEDVVHRRYKRSLLNLFNLYLPIVDYWMIYDNSTTGSYPELLTRGPSND